MGDSIKYLRNSYKKSYDNPIGSVYVNKIKIYIKDPLPKEVDFRQSIEFILKKLPESLLKNIDTISIGDFIFLKQRQVDAIYRNGNIFLSNNQLNNYDLMSDLIHEIAHCFEEQNKDFIYSDEEIKQEFLSKRRQLFYNLTAHIELPDEITEKDFYNINYSPKFDSFLYNKIGYEKLQNFTNNLFVSPYAATSLREYFANAFENYFINDMFIVKKYANKVYNKLINFLEF